MVDMLHEGKMMVHPEKCFSPADASACVSGNVIKQQSYLRPLNARKRLASTGYTQGSSVRWTDDLFLRQNIPGLQRSVFTSYLTNHPCVITLYVYIHISYTQIHIYVYNIHRHIYIYMLYIYVVNINTIIESHQQSKFLAFGSYFGM